MASLRISSAALIVSAGAALSAAQAQLPNNFGGVPAPTPRAIGDKSQPASAPHAVNIPPGQPGGPPGAGPRPPNHPGRPGHGGHWYRDRWHRPRHPGYSALGYPTDDLAFAAVTNQGVSAAVVHNGEHWKFALELNLAAPAILSHGACGLGPVGWCGTLNWLDWYRWSSWRSYYFYDPGSYQWYYFGNEPIYGTLSRVEYAGLDPFVTQGTQWANGGPSKFPAVVDIRRPLTLVERGDILMSEGDIKGAIDAYREYITGADTDADAMRRLAAALLLDGRMLEGVAMMAMAYDTDPTIAARPLDTQAMGLSDNQVRDRVTAAMNYANRVKTASSFLTAMVFMQAQQNTDGMRRVLERATAAGMEARIADAWRAALTK